MPSKRQKPYAFDPQSLDAQLAGIHAALTGMSERMDTKFDAVAIELKAIKTQVTATNGRVTALEFWRDTSKAKLAGIAATMGAVGTVLWGLLKTAFIKASE
jgi:hypothetical protein